MIDRRATCPTCGKKVLFFSRTGLQPHSLRLHIDIRTGEICKGHCTAAAVMKLSESLQEPVTTHE